MLRVRKQWKICKDVGCKDFDNESILVNIVLEGIPSYRSYTATLAELQSRFRLNPSSISMAHLEEVFFNIDSNHQAIKSTKKESAMYSNSSQSSIKCYYCDKPGHKKSECRLLKANKANNSNNGKSSFQGKKRELSEVTCYKCRQKGHYASKCPQKKKENNNFEAAHVAISSSDEQAHAFIECFDEYCMMTNEHTPFFEI